MGADETVVRVKGEKTVVGVVADAETGKVLGLEALVERDSDGFMERLGDFVSGYGAEAMVADDLSAYKPVVERLGIERWICTAHVKRWVWNRRDGIDGCDWGKTRIWQLALRLRLGYPAFGARGSRRRRDSSPPAQRLPNRFRDSCLSRGRLSGGWGGVL